MNTDPIDLLNEMVKVDVDLIENHPENPRIGNVEAIMASLLALGQFEPLVVQTSTSYILSGNHCVDVDTEALTQRGWVNGWDITEDDVILSVDKNKKLVWGPVRSVFRNPDYSGPMHRLENRAFTSLVSPGHRFMVNEGELKPVESLLTQDTLVLMGDALVSDGGTHSDEFVELVGWAVTEGSYRKGWKPYVRISQLPGQYAGRIRQCLEAVGAEFQVGLGGRQGRVLSFNVRNEIAEELYRVAPNRVMTMEFITSLSASQRSLLIETMIDADGHRIFHEKSTSRFFTQLSQESMDAFVSLCAISGLTTKVSLRVPPKTAGEYRNSKPYLVASVRNSNTSSLKAGKIRRGVEDYSGLIWCPETDHGTFVCRKDGKVHLTGNTYKAIRELGWTEAHVVYLDVDDGPARRIMLAANKIAEMGTYNAQLLAELITAAMEDDEALLESTGYSDEEIDTLLSEALDFDFGFDEESTEGVGAVAAVLDRITPVEGDDGVIDGDDDDVEPFVPQASKGGGGHAASTVGSVETEFVIFRFGELRAKVPRGGYETYITAMLKEHAGDLQLAGVSAAVSLGLDSEGVEPAIANGAERWL